jgi:hypothetical protein
VVDFPKADKASRGLVGEMEGRLPFIRPGLNGNVVPFLDIKAIMAAPADGREDCSHKIIGGPSERRTDYLP